MGIEYDEINEHESFGLLSINRQSGSSRRLFGSNIANSATFCITLKRAKHYRMLNNDWYSGKETLVEIEMTPAQFVQAITMTNHGDGTPCTIRRLVHKNGLQHLEDVPGDFNSVEKTRNEFQKQVQTKMTEFDIENSLKIIKESKLTVVQKKSLIETFQSLQRFASDSAPFIVDQFTRATDKIVSEAKAELEAVVTHTVMKTGIDTLLKQREERILEIESRDV